MALSKSRGISENNKTSETELKTRYFDIGDLPRQRMLPITGYQCEKLLSLKLALEPVKHLLKINHQIEIALENCLCPSDGLTQDESAAIHIYTMEWLPYQKCVYYVLNQTLRLENRRLLRPWFKYLKLILTGLYKLKRFRGTVWRGVKLDLSSEYPTGKIFNWWGFSSCTKSLDVMESPQFLGTAGPRTLFSIECEDGRNIQNHSYIVSENEILLLPGRKLQVVGHVRIAEDAWIIQLKELIPKYPLLANPSDTSDLETMIYDDSIDTDQPHQPLGNMSDIRDKIIRQRTRTSIDIVRTRLNDQDLELLADELEVNQNWSILEFACNTISDRGFDYICRGLKNNHRLSEVHIYECQITDSITRLIADTLKRNHTLKQLSLSKNFISDPGCQALGDMLKLNGVLEHLILDQNQIKDKGIRYILFALANVNDTLKELNVSRNDLTDKCVENFVEMIQQNRTITKLCLEDNKITKTGSRHIQEAAQRNQVLIDLQL